MNFPKRLLLTILFTFYFLLLTSQVRIRLLTDIDPSYTFFSVTSGSYDIDPGTGAPVRIDEGEIAVISRFDGRIAIRVRNIKTVLADSVLFKGSTGKDRFTLRMNEGNPVSRNYIGDLQCLPDFGGLLLINICDIDSYIAGVVKAEGGSGQNGEYFKTQAVIARTYTYKYYNKHIIDRYNLCDDTHCQSFLGIVTDTLITNAVIQTKDIVIATPDSNLIISAFHSNCGGETSPSEYAWLTKQPYLTRVADPYCLTSRNATWQKIISLKEWIKELKKNGYQGESSDASDFIFNQPSRVQNYVTGSFSVPLRLLREDLGFRSSFFSISADGDSLLIRGRGYGHGVGLCQEGAMVMAFKGFSFSDIIRFYYPGVILLKIGDTKKTDNEK